jgi:hypothetical protein
VIGAKREIVDRDAGVEDRFNCLENFERLSCYVWSYTVAGNYSNSCHGRIRMSGRAVAVIAQRPVVSGGTVASGGEPGGTDMLSGTVAPILEIENIHAASWKIWRGEWSASCAGMGVRLVVGCGTPSRMLAYKCDSDPLPSTHAESLSEVPSPTTPSPRRP